MSDALPPVTRAALDNARRALGLNHSSVHLVPRITTQEANAARVAALEALLRAVYPVSHAYGCDDHHSTIEGRCTCGADAHNAAIDALLSEAG